MRNTRQEDSTLEDFDNFNCAMASHTRVGCFDCCKGLLQVVAGFGFKRAPAFQAVDEVGLRCVNAVSTVSDS